MVIQGTISPTISQGWESQMNEYENECTIPPFLNVKSMRYFEIMIILDFPKREYSHREKEKELR